MGYSDVPDDASLRLKIGKTFDSDKVSRYLLSKPPPIQEHAVQSETTLRKFANLPEFLQKVFQCVDKKDFEGLKGFVSEDFRLYSRTTR